MRAGTTVACRIEEGKCKFLLDSFWTYEKNLTCASSFNVFLPANKQSTPPQQVVEYISSPELKEETTPTTIKEPSSTQQQSPSQIFWWLLDGLIKKSELVDIPLEAEEEAMVMEVAHEVTEEWNLEVQVQMQAPMEVESRVVIYPN